MDISIASVLLYFFSFFFFYFLLETFYSLKKLKNIYITHKKPANMSANNVLMKLTVPNAMKSKTTT